jgi:hypothetical protein
MTIGGGVRSLHEPRSARLPRVLSTIFLLACIATIVVAQAFILRSALRALAVTSGGPLPHPHRVTEVIWAVLPAVALGLVLWVTWQESRVSTTAPSDQPVEHAEHRAHTS